MERYASSLHTLTNRTYEPPAGMEPVGVSVTFKDSPFEFDALANKPGVKLWAIRIPSDVCGALYVD